MRTTPERYSIAVPAGWVRIPGGIGSEHAAQHAVAEALGAGAPEGSWTTELGSQLRTFLEADSLGLVLDSYVPAGGVPGTSLSCCVVVTAVQVEAAPNGDLDDLLLAQLATHRGQLLDIAGAPAVRWWEREAPAEGLQPQGVRTLGARVVLTRVPERSDLLLMLRLTVATRTEAPHDADDVAGEQVVVDALGILFDAMCASVQWRSREGDHLVVEPDGTVSR
jgi:hypothetical protein